MLLDIRLTWIFAKLVILQDSVEEVSLGLSECHKCKTASACTTYRAVLSCVNVFSHFFRSFCKACLIELPLNWSDRCVRFNTIPVGERQIVVWNKVAHRKAF